MSTDLKHTCHECGGRTSYPDHAKGMEIKCPHCGKSTSLGEVYPANPAPQPAASSSPPTTASPLVGTTSGHSAPAGFAIAGKRIGWPVWAGAGLVVAALCVGLFFYLRPINVTGHLYVVTKGNSVVNIPDTAGFVLADKEMKAWVDGVNSVTAKFKSEAEQAVVPLVSEIETIATKKAESWSKEQMVREERNGLEVQKDRLRKESDLVYADELAVTVGDISSAAHGLTRIESEIRFDSSKPPPSPIKSLIEGLRDTRRTAVQAKNFGEMTGFVLETNLLVHASNTVVIARNHHLKMSNAARQQRADALDVREAYSLATKATNALISLSNLLARAEELRPKREEFVKILNRLEELAAALETFNIASSRLFKEASEKEEQVVTILRAAKKNINVVPLDSLRKIFGLDGPVDSRLPSDAPRNVRDGLWRFQTDAEGKMSLHLPKKGVYHFVCVVKYRDEILFVYKRMEFVGGRDHKVSLNQDANLTFDYEAWVPLGFKIQAPELPNSKDAEITKDLREKLLK